LPPTIVIEKIAMMPT